MTKEEATRRLNSFKPIIAIVGIKKDGVSFDSILAVDDAKVNDLLGTLSQARVFSLTELDINTFVEKLNTPPKKHIV